MINQSKKIAFLTIISLIMLASSSNLQAQTTTFKEKKIGHVFYMQVPDYMAPTLGINADAIAQYRSEVNGLYTCVINDTKEDLAMAEMKIANATEFYDIFMKEFLKGSKDLMIFKPRTYTIGAVNFVQVEATYFDDDAKMKIYYMITIAETPTGYYKVLSYTFEPNAKKLRDDLIKMANSLHE